MNGLPDAAGGSGRAGVVDQDVVMTGGVRRHRPLAGHVRGHHIRLVELVDLEDRLAGTTEREIRSPHPRRRSLHPHGGNGGEQPGIAGDGRRDCQRQPLLSGNRPESGTRGVGQQANRGGASRGGRRHANAIGEDRGGARQEGPRLPSGPADEDACGLDRDACHDGNVLVHESDPCFIARKAHGAGLRPSTGVGG